MADPDKEQPSLELPKLGGLRRRPRRQRAEAPPAEPTPPPEPVVEQTRPIVVDPGPRPVAEPRREPEPVLDPGLEPQPVPEPAVDGTRAVEPRRRSRAPRGPGGMLAAVFGGLVVGLGIVCLTWASLRACEGVQGTASCGKVGYPVLALILVVMVLVGALLLRLTRVPDPTTTSFLGVGLAVVVALLVLVDHLMDRSMVVVVPVVCAATFALAHWVTRTFVEPPRD